MICRTRTERTASRDRRAFTLPELLVVVTVTLVLMSILVSASGIITATISNAKAQGDFVAQERATLAILRRDLQYSHFLDEDAKPNHGRRLSDQHTQNMTVSGSTIAGYKPPKYGYFWASSRPAVSTQLSDWVPGNSATWNFKEGDDAEGFNSSRSANHFLQFTIILPGGEPVSTLTADVPYGNPSNSSAYPITGTCAEVAYFLSPNGTTPAGVPKYKLIRRQRLAARNEDDRPAYEQLLNSSNVAADDPPEVMAAAPRMPLTNPAQFDMFDLNRLTLLGNRVSRQSLSAHRTGEDILNHNVTSFEIKFTGPKATGVAWQTEAGTEWPRSFSSINTDYPYDNLPFDGDYDTTDVNAVSSTTNLATASNQTGRLKPIRITGAMIRLRCWNPSIKTTRQSTLTVDL